MEFVEFKTIIQVIEHSNILDVKKKYVLTIVIKMNNSLINLQNMEIEHGTWRKTINDNLPGFRDFKIVPLHFNLQYFFFSTVAKSKVRKTVVRFMGSRSTFIVREMGLTNQKTAFLRTTNSEKSPKMQATDWSISSR